MSIQGINIWITNREKKIYNAKNRKKILSWDWTVYIQNFLYVISTSKYFSQFANEGIHPGKMY